MDVTVYHRGFHSDLNETLFVGKVDEDSRRVVTCAYECLQKAIAIGTIIRTLERFGHVLILCTSTCGCGCGAVKPGVRYRDVGDVIQKHAQSMACSVVRTYCGHGCNRCCCFPFFSSPLLSSPRPRSVFTVRFQCSLFNAHLIVPCTHIHFTFTRCTRICTQAVPRAAIYPALREEQSDRHDARRPRVHHRANDQPGHLARRNLAGRRTPTSTCSYTHDIKS